jgi:transposase
VTKHQEKGFTMVRLQLTDKFWSRLRDIFLHCGAYNTDNLRMTVEGNDWSLQGKLKNIFLILTNEPDHEWTFIDGSIATRYEKLKRNYEGMLYLACSIIWLPM